MISVDVLKQAYQMWYGWFELLRGNTQQHLQDVIILWNCTQHNATCTVPQASEQVQEQLLSTLWDAQFLEWKCIHCSAGTKVFQT